MALHTFPTRAEGKLDIWEVDNADVQFSEWKYCCRCLPEPVWRSAYCVCLENEQKFLIFSNYLESLKYPSPKHIPVSILGQNSLQNSHGPVESTISGPGSSAENLQATRKPITPCPTTCQCDLALHGFCVNSSQGNLSAPVPNSTYPNLQEKLPQLYLLTTFLCGPLS
ncbi:hypothetical protein EG68_09023 [Paragonimus skrjabini miyazakii]|uniref:Uncharacterized protein n=1 Tax=Paragonimus skrjabini miyazakii TaxID=59628 RepID=A0A8S9YMQ1_9TREM|nr:hypothetical protein EG68_09023 [Paragonimus skrjabini miyazakii]